MSNVLVHANDFYRKIYLFFFYLCSQFYARYIQKFVLPYKVWKNVYLFVCSLAGEEGDDYTKSHVQL